MSDTTIIPLNSDTWTDISTAAGLTGFVSNSGAQRVIYREKATAPDNSENKGHSLLPKDSINYVITAGAVYAKTVRGNGSVAVTGA